MSWKDGLKKSMQSFRQLTDNDWETGISFNDIYILANTLQKYAERMLRHRGLPEEEEEELEKMLEAGKQLEKLDSQLEDILIDIREMLLSKGL